MRIAICEDNPTDVDAMTDLLRQLICDVDELCEWDCFMKGELLLDAIKQDKQYDLILLDIYIDVQNGIEIAQQIRKNNKQAEIAFVTSSREFALEAFEVEALHYLIKPVTREQIENLLNRYATKKGKEKSEARLMLGKNQVVIRQSLISKISSERKGIHIYQKNGMDQWFRFSFMNIEEQMEQKQIY